MSFLNRAPHGRVVYSALIFVILLAAVPALAETSVPYEWPSIFAPRNFSADSAHLLTVFNEELIVYRLDDQGEEGEIKGLGRWDGQGWKPMGGLGRKLDVKALCPYDNKLFVGGSPDLSESEVNALAIWDGTRWLDFGNDVEGNIQAMVQWRGLLVMGGQFKVQGFPDTRNLIAWDGDSWQELPTSGLGGAYNAVRALAVHGDDLIVGGLFAEVGGVKAQNVARFDGDLWYGVGGGTDGAVTHLASYKGVIFVAGLFSRAGDNPCTVLAGWNGDKWLDTESAFKNRRFQKNFGPVRTVKVRNGRLYVCGFLSERRLSGGGNIISWDGRIWQEEDTPDDGPDRVVPVLDLDFFKGKLVVSAPGNKISHPNYWGHTNNAIVTWDGEQWAWIDWDDRIILHPFPKMTLYENELIVGSRMGPYGAAALEVWRDGHWQVLLHRSDFDSPDGVLVRGLQAVGKNLYLLAVYTGEVGSNRFAVFHYNGRTAEQLGPLFESESWHSVKMVADKERVVLVRQQKMERRSPLRTNISIWEETAWVALDSVPALRKFSAVTVSPEGIFVATPSGSYVNTVPRIWRWFDNQWELVFEQKSGFIPFFHQDGEQLWAGVSYSNLENDPSPPLIRWDGSRWQPFGEILINNQREEQTSQLKSMTVYQGNPVISARVQDAGRTENSDKGDGVYYWQDAQWHKFSAYDGAVAGMLAHDNRLWINISDNGKKPDYPLTWYDGKLVSDIAIAPNQLELWQARAEERKELNQGNLQLQSWESLPLEIPFPGSDQPISRKVAPHRPTSGWGWFGFNKKTIGPSLVDVVETEDNTLTRLFDRYEEIALEFPGDEGVRYRVSFDIRMKSQGLRKGNFVVAFESNDHYKTQDRCHLSFDPRNASIHKDGFQTVTMMCRAETDTTQMTLRFNARKFPGDASVEIINLKIIPSTQTLLECFDEAAVILSTQYRRLDGTHATIEDPLPGRLAAAEAQTNFELGRVIRNLRSYLASRNEMDPRIFPPGEDLKAREQAFAENRNRIDGKLVNKGGKKTTLGWLSDNTFYIREPNWIDLNTLLNDDQRDFSLRNLGPDTRMILDLRREPARSTPGRKYQPNVKVEEWLNALAVAGALVDEPTEIFGYLGDDAVVNDPRLEPFVKGDMSDAHLNHLVVRPARTWSPRGQIVVLVNEWSHALSILALKGRSGVLVVGHPAGFIMRPLTRFILSNGMEYPLPTGILLGPGGENIQTTGVIPDVWVDWELERDLVFEKAMEILEMKMESKPPD